MPLWTRNSARGLIGRVADYLFPPLCVVCDSPRSTEDSWFCPECIKHLIQNHFGRDACPRCSQNRKARSCSCVHAWDYPFTEMLSILDYDERVQAIMHQIKYRGKRALAYHVGSLLSALVPESVFDSTDLVVVIPLHPSRERQRGYNQAAWFAQGLLHAHPALQLDSGIIERIKKTRTQTKLDRSSRRSNVHGAFRIRDAAVARIHKKRILLIDDVVTTGATTAACSEALIAAGCLEVRVLSLARD